MYNLLTTPLATSIGAYYSQWALLGILLLIGLAFGVGNVIISHTLGPEGLLHKSRCPTAPAPHYNGGKMEK